MALDLRVPSHTAPTSVPLDGVRVDLKKRSFETALGGTSTLTTPNRATKRVARSYEHLDSPVASPSAVPSHTITTAALSAQTDAQTGTSSSGPSNRTLRGKDRRSAYRAKKKDAAFVVNSTTSGAKAARKYVQVAATLSTPLDAQALCVTSTAYEARSKGSGSTKNSQVQSYADLKRKGYRTIKWDGTWVTSFAIRGCLVLMDAFIGVHCSL